MATRTDALTLNKAVHENLTVDVELITPEMAAEYLEKNKDNRQPTERHIKYLASQMNAGKWYLTHQGIAFDANGDLRDGQHRLFAVLRSMSPQEMLVIRGLEPETFQVMDTGKNRTAADILHIEGYDKYSPKMLATATRGIIEWQHGIYRNMFKSTLFITNFMILNFVNENKKKLLPMIQKFQPLASKHKNIWPGANAVWMSYVFSEIKDCDENTAFDFFEKLYTGANLSESDPILFLRNWLQQDKFQTHRATKQMKMAMIIKGWNFHRQGVPTRKMWHWKKKEESFPVPI